jgi:hypothetical protein
MVYFWEMSGWRKYFGAWDMVVVLAYVLASALIESFSVLSILVLLRVVLPVQVFRTRFVAKVTALVLFNALWAVLLHLMILSEQILTWTLERWLLCGFVYLLSIGFSWAFVHLSDYLARRIEAFVDRVTVFLYLYVPLSVAGILLVIARNIL